MNAPVQTNTLRDLQRSWRVQRRIIYALLMREVLTRYGRHNIGFLWLFVEPMIFTLGITALWTATQALHGSDLPIAAFALTGYSSVLLWRNMPSRCIGAVQPNLSLMYHRNVKVIDIFLSRLILEAGGATISFILLAIVFTTIGLIDPPEDILMIAWGWTMLAFFGMSLALFLGALSEQSELVEKLWHPLAYLLFPLSGSAFLVDALPPAAQKIVLLLPMVHGVEYVREGYFGSRVVSHYDLGYMATISLLLCLFAFAQMRLVSRTLTPE
jgi:ABC-2 type transport system permease protein/capsular polysaccharide transport system permease protein